MISTGAVRSRLTMEDALELFKLPRDLGETADGLKVSASIGRFGPYVRYGDKYVSIKEDDPYTIELPRALELIEQKKIDDANKIIQDFKDDKIQVLNGPYGPYVKDFTLKKNARVPKDRDPKSLTLEECKELIAAAPVRGRKGKKKKTTGKQADSVATSKEKAKKKTASKKKTSKKATKKVAKTAAAQVESDEPPF